MNINEKIAHELNIPEDKLNAAVELLDAGNTVPFVARYRKEATGGLDDGVLRNLLERLTYLRNLEKRKDEVKSLIEGQGKLTDELVAAIDKAESVTEVDDIYRPYRPKRKTRASVARERGLEPLSKLISEQRKKYSPTIEQEAEKYLTDEVKTVSDALAGAKDIIAEEVSDNADYRRMIRSLTARYGKLTSKMTKENATYEQYSDYSEPISKLPPHRILAINRGEKEEALTVSVEIDRDIILNALFSEVIKDYKSPAFTYVSSAVSDSYYRLIAPSIEREIRTELTDNASESAISLFAVNLKNLLMQSPLKGKTVLGYDPGYRTGCKLAVVTKTGAVADTAVIYPTKPHEKIE